jgi:hypothetical protein
MAEQQGSWPAAAPPPGWVPPHPARPTAPPALFGGPPRPVYREAHPVNPGPLLAGLGAGLVWFALFGSIGRDLLSYAWWTVVAALTAWAVSVLLAIFGDRGVAVGVAIASSLGLSIAMAFVAARWITTNNWPMW